MEIREIQNHSSPVELEDMQSSVAIHQVDSDFEDTERRSSYSIGIPRQVGIAAGVAVAMTAGTISQVINHAPEYEGSFQLTVQPHTDAAAVTATPQIEEVNQTITDTDIRILESPHLLDPIIKRLQADNPDLDFRRFTDNLKIRQTGEHHLEVRYQDTDPQQVQTVLNQLSQTYLDYSQDCQTSACKGLTFVDTQIPQIQQRISDLRQQIQQFHQENGLKNLQAQVRIFSSRSTEISRQHAEIQGKLADARNQYNELQSRMALQRDEAIAQGLLDRDAQYQELFQQFSALDQQLVVAMGSYQANDEQLQTLKEQHQTVVNQLNQTVGQVLQRYVNNPSANLQDPVFQDPNLLNLLQRSIGTVHYLQVLEVRQQTIAQAQETVDQRKQELATVLRHYADLRQDLQAETQILQQYIDKRNIFQSQVEQQQRLSWQLAEPPQLVVNASGEPAPDYFHRVREDFGSAAVFGALMGVAIAVIMQEKHSRSTSLLGATPLGKKREPDYPTWNETVAYHAPSR